MHMSYTNSEFAFVDRTVPWEYQWPPNERFIGRVDFTGTNVSRVVLWEVSPLIFSDGRRRTLGGGCETMRFCVALRMCGHSEEGAGFGADSSGGREDSPVLHLMTFVLLKFTK